MSVNTDSGDADGSCQDEEYDVYRILYREKLSHRIAIEYGCFIKQGQHRLAPPYAEQVRRIKIHILYSNKWLGVIFSG